MEITYLGGDKFKIKGKTGVVSVDSIVVVIENLEGHKKEIMGPGEYEISGISVIGIQNDDLTIFVYEVDGLRVCNLGKTSKKLIESKLSMLGDIDVLLLSVSDISVELIQQIDPYFVIPFNFKEDSLDKFLKSSGLVVEKLPKFSLKKEEIIDDQTTEIKLLESRS
jgi:hypothetical protein